MTNEELVKRYQEGDSSAFDTLLENNRGIIGTMVHKWWQKVLDDTVTAEELENECIYAFFIAITKYKTDCGLMLSTWLFNNINWYLQRFFKVKHYISSTGEKVSIVSLDEIVPGTDNLTIADTIPDEDSELMMEVFVDSYERKILKKELCNLLKAVLSEQEQNVLLWHYGIDCKPLSYSQIATKMMITQSRVGQIEAVAIRKIIESDECETFKEKYNVTVNDMKNNSTSEKTVDEKSYSDAIKMFNI